MSQRVEMTPEQWAAMRQIPALDDETVRISTHAGGNVKLVLVYDDVIQNEF